MNLYLDNGYINIPEILATGYPFIFITGGRGTGKTYTALKYAVEQGKRFLLLRRTQTQIDLINTPEYNIFTPLNKDLGWNIIPKKVSKNNACFYQATEEGPTGEPLGMTAALSTISNIRGFDSSKTEIIIYDEFCPEKHEKMMKYEAVAFFNAVETINRNRELAGGKPVQVLSLANANDLANPIFTELGIISTIDRMRKKGREVYTDDRRGLMVICLKSSPISAQKSKTALYKLTEGSDFSKMSIENDFAEDHPTNVKSIPLNECRPIVSIGELTIYKHKFHSYLYISLHSSGTVPKYGTNDIEVKRFLKTWGWIWSEYISNNCYFQEYACEILLTKYLA